MQAVSRRWERQGSRLLPPRPLPGASEGNAALLTPSFHHSEARFGLLTTSNVR